MKFHIWGYENICYGFKGKNYVMWYWWRHTRKNWISYANHEIRRKYYWIFIIISENLYFRTDRCCIVFGENRNSLSIQNGGSKFSKFAYFIKISQFCFDFKTKCIFVISIIVWFQNYIFFMYFSVYFRFKKFYFRFKLKRQYL